MKKKLAMFMSMIMLAAALGGCGSKEATGTDAKKTDEVAKPAEGGEAKVVKLMFWDDLNTTKDLMSLEYKKRIEEFNAKNNGYKIEVISSTIADYDAKLNAMVASGTAPDMFFCSPGPNMNQYVKADAVMAMDEILASDKAWSDSFLDGIFDRISYDGKKMAMPLNFAAACVFYNTEIFKKVGVEVPKTWDEFLVVCEKVKAAGYDPIAASGKDAWCIAIPAGYLCDRAGGPANIEGVLSGTTTFEDPSYIKAGNMLVDLVDKGYFQKTMLGDGNDQATANFYNGKAAMVIQGSWAIGQINGNGPEVGKVTGVFPFPAVDASTGDGNRWVVKTDNICISKNSKNVEGCTEFLKSLTSESAQKASAEVAGKIPVIKNANVDLEKAPKQFAYLNEAMKTMSGTLGFYNEMLPNAKLGDEFNNTIVAIVTKAKTPEQAFKDLAAFVESNK